MMLVQFFEIFRMVIVTIFAENDFIRNCRDFLLKSDEIQVGTVLPLTGPVSETMDFCRNHENLREKSFSAKMVAITILNISKN